MCPNAEMEESISVTRGFKEGLILMIYISEVFCPKIIPNVQLTQNCSAKVGANCSDFTCNRGYERNENATSLSCKEDGRWSLNESVLCLGTVFNTLSMLVKIL